MSNHCRPWRRRDKKHLKHLRHKPKKVWVPAHMTLADEGEYADLPEELKQLEDRPPVE